MSEEETSMRDDFEAAIADIDDGVEEETLEVVSEDTPEPIQEAAEETSEEVPDEPTEEPQAAAEAPAETSTTRPPVGWSPTNKQKWSEIPKEIQEAVIAREREVDGIFRETAEARRTHDQFKQLTNSYAPVFAAEGVQDPMQGIQGLVSITAELQNGSPAQKAQRIAAFVRHYGVDINMLDSALAGEETQDPQATQFQQMLDQRLAPVNQLMTQLQQSQAQQQEQVYTSANQSIAEFGADPKNEFFDDVRMVMADFMDIARQNNQPMSLQEAYDRACAINPEISGIIASKRTQEMAQTNAVAAQKKRNAGSSITGRRQGVSAGNEDLSMRELIAAQLQQQ